jgi:hypothetical protein
MANESIISLILAKRVQFYKGQIRNKYKTTPIKPTAGSGSNINTAPNQDHSIRTSDLKNRSYQLIQDFFSE